MFQKRRQRNRSRSQNFSFSSWPSDPRLMSLWSQPEQPRNDSTRASVEQMKPRWGDAPPPYEVLFLKNELNCSPPTYSSLALNQPSCSVAVSSDNPTILTSSNPFVTVVIERESETVPDVPTHLGARFQRSSSVPASIGSSGSVTHISVLFHAKNREA